MTEEHKKNCQAALEEAKKQYIQEYVEKMKENQEYADMYLKFVYACMAAADYSEPVKIDISKVDDELWKRVFGQGKLSNSYLDDDNFWAIIVDYSNNSIPSYFHLIDINVINHLLEENNIKIFLDNYNESFKIKFDVSMLVYTADVDRESLKSEALQLYKKQLKNS